MLHRGPCATALLLLVLSACAAPSRALWHTVHSAGADAAVTVALDGDRPREIAIGIARTSLPIAVGRAVDQLMPEGTWRACAAVHTPAGSVDYRVTKEYQGGHRRSARLDSDGTVVERSHDLAPDEVPDTVRRALAEAAPGPVTRIAAVQGGDADREFYRGWARGADGRPWRIDCDAHGHVQRRLRRQPATLWVTIP